MGVIWEAHSEGTEAETREHGRDARDGVVEADEVVEFLLSNLKCLNLEIRQGGVLICRQHDCLKLLFKLSIIISHNENMD